MNPRQLYLGYVRSAHPKLYYAALNRVFNPKAGLSGLGDDLTDTVTPDLTSGDTLLASATPDISSDTSDSINAAYNASMSSASSGSGGGTDFFNSLANAISTIAPTVVQTQAAENLLQINTQRAQMGLPPLTANGVPVTGSMLSPTSSSIAQMEAALAGGTSSLLPILLIAGVGIAVLAVSKK